MSFVQHFTNVLLIMKLGSVLHCSIKLFYPECVGQADANWLVTPLGTRLLHAIANYTPEEKYAQVNKVLNTTDHFTSKTAIFFSKEYSGRKWRSLELSNLYEQEVDFHKNVFSDLQNWIQQYEGFNNVKLDIRKHVPSDVILATINICDYKDLWEAPGNKGRVMKVHNSFKYTQDVQYEATVSELPLGCKTARLLVLLPTEAELMTSMFHRLMTEGLAGYFSSIQPVFTTDAVFHPPAFDIASQVHVRIESNSTVDVTREKLVQFGNLTVDEFGVQARVLSCLFVTQSKMSQPKEMPRREKAPFFFAITCQDAPIFTGQYAPFLYICESLSNTTGVGRWMAERKPVLDPQYPPWSTEDCIVSQY